MRLIDADELKEFINEGKVCDICDYKKPFCVHSCDFPDYLTPLWEKVIDNAPTVDTTCPNCDSSYAQGYSDGYLKGKEERPQGSCKELLKELKNCRNELCLKCGKYNESYKGACDDCRYNFENMKKWEAENEFL